MPWDRLLRNHFSMVLVAPLSWMAFLNADGVASLVKGTRPPERALLSDPGRPPEPPDPFHSTSARSILDHNPFDSTLTSLWPRPADGHESNAPPEDDAPSCAGVRVVAIAASDDPAWSFAALKTGEQPVALRRRGGAVDSKTVAFVAEDRVWLESGGRFCQTVMFSPEEAPPASDSADREAARPQLVSAPPLDPSLARGIHARGPLDFDVDRGVVERLLTDTASLLGSTRSRVENVNGQPAGVKLSGISKGSALETLGILNGDRLETINGFDLSHPESALEAYARLRESPHLALRVNRGGHEVDLTYDVR